MEFEDYIAFSPGPTMIQRDSMNSQSLGLAIFGLASAALCVWLTVRIVNRKERWAKWTLAAVIGLPALYVMSFGPACWLTDWLDRKRNSSDFLEVAYYPLLFVAARAPECFGNSLVGYGDPHDTYGTAWYLIHFARNDAWLQFEDQWFQSR